MGAASAVSILITLRTVISGAFCGLDCSLLCSFSLRLVCTSYLNGREQFARTDGPRCECHLGQDEGVEGLLCRSLPSRSLPITLFARAGVVDEWKGHVCAGSWLERRAVVGCKDAKCWASRSLSWGRAGRRCGCTKQCAVYSRHLLVHGRFCLCAVVILPVGDCARSVMWLACR
jgi:hypothetical protein